MEEVPQSTTPAPASEPESESNEPVPWGKLISAVHTIPHCEMIENRFVVGRGGKCNLKIFEKQISGVHFRIIRDVGTDSNEPPIVYLEDHSSNGTFVNGIKIGKGKKHVLQNADQITLVTPSSKKWSFLYQDFTFLGKSEHPEISEKYNLLEEIGKGTFSVVRLAIDKETEERVAIKIIDKRRFWHLAKTREQLTREVTILKQIKHPYIISIHDLVETKEYLYIVLELATGGDLFESLKKKSRYSEQDAKRIFKQILEALQYLHNEKQTAHRDLKPENILLASTERDSSIKLTDFGLARIVQNSQFMCTMCGTPEYVAPEVLAGDKQQWEGYGLEVDMWSAGVLLYILLSGFPPFYEDQANKINLYKQIREGNYQFTPESVWRNISSYAKDLITKLIEVDPKIRYTVDQALAHQWIVSDSSCDNPLNVHSNLKRTMSALRRNSRNSLSIPEEKPSVVASEDTEDEDGKENAQAGKKRKPVDKVRSPKRRKLVDVSDDGTPSSL